MLLQYLKRFGKAVVIAEVSALAGLYYVFHDINTGGPDSRIWWDERFPFLIDSFHKITGITGDDRVIEHRTSGNDGKDKGDL
mmetsp:Transcript_16319/g.36517  ORF Transcript_16319/g.36517 Transcript_16319/m.36517 type:complete len:82 (-) Transcript_16319:65-310(-)